MQLRHTYREFSLENRVFKGEAWVSGQESSSYAKDYAKENPAVLRDKIKENTKEEWQKLADDFNEGLGRLLSKVPSRKAATLEQRFMPVAQTSVEKGVFALLKQKMPNLFPDAESLQMAYKYTMMQTGGKVNILEAGDIISLKNGVLNVSKPDGRVMYETELYPWSLFDEPVYTPQNTETPAPTPVEPALAKEPGAAPTDTAPTQAPAEPIQTPTEEPPKPATTPEPLEEEKQSKREQALEAVLAVEADSLKITDPEATLKKEGPNHWEITTPNGTIDIKVPPFGVVEDLNSDPENNVSIIAKKTDGKRERFRTVGEALDHLRQPEPKDAQQVAEEKPQEEEKKSKREQALAAAIALETASLKSTDPDATLEKVGPNHWKITTPNGEIDINVPPFGVVEDLNSNPENNVSIIAQKTDGKRERFRTVGEALDHLRQPEPKDTQQVAEEKPEENEKQDSVGLAVAKVTLDRMVKGEFAVNGDPARYTAEQHGRRTHIQIVRADGRKAEINIQRTRGGEFKAGMEQFTNDNGFEISLQVDGLPKQTDIKSLTEVLERTQKGFEAPLIKTPEKPVEAPSFEKGLRIFDLENAKTSTGFLLQDAPLGQILGEGVNPQVVGRLGKYPITIYEKTTEGISGGISLEDFYVKVLIKNDGSAQMEIHAQDEFDKAARSYDSHILDSASVSSSAEARNFLEDFQDQIGKNQEETAPSPKEKREQKEAEKAEIEALEASLKEPYIEALRRLVEKHPEITKFKVDEQLDRLTPKFSIKKDPENPALCTLTLGFMYRDVWVGAEQPYRYNDLKDNVEEAAKALAFDTLGGLEAATPEPK